MATRRKPASKARSARRSPAAAPSEAPPIAGVNPAAPDHVSPAQSPAFPIAAIGASAGGLEAFTELLANLPKDTGIAYVLIQHLLPAHESMLSAILGRATRMKVSEVENNMRVEPNHVYVIPPGKSMVLSHGALQLAPRTEVKGIARPVDHFMRSLAEEHGHKSIGVVLSGTGNDGTLGLQEIKAAGGLTFAQDATASQAGMPSSAIASGAVDMVLPANEIALELGRVGAHPYVSPARPADPPVTDPAFLRVVEMLARTSDVDFTSYKKNTLYRRIARRMIVRSVQGMADYEVLLRREPGELDALYQDVLINVTSFFRNPEAYEALKQSVFPSLVGDDGRRNEVRVWALGCSTGEEAYSLAMTFTEYLENTGQRVALQVFATDLNSAGIEKARAGVYPKGIEQDVSPERLRRFFVEVDGSYRIAKPIRDMCVFARQNVLTDPPFSRIDLVACRNMLIYLEPGLQKKLIPLLHFALRMDGFLWLGGSETIGQYRDLFELIDARNKIYAKKGGAAAAPDLPGRARSDKPRWHAPLSAMGKQDERALGDHPDIHAEADRLLLERYGPPAILVNAAFDVLQYRGDTGAYLTPAPGKASLSLLKMLRDNLVVPVRGALHRAREENRPVRVERQRVKSADGWRDVDIVAAPLGDGAFVVLFEEGVRSREQRAKKIHAEADSRIDRGARPVTRGKSEAELSRLSQELAATREYLQSVIEEQDAANEELQSANEEAQSANEELQSVNEELETSKEEIQASNEELVTLNQELANRNSELARTNSDLVNLMGSVQMSIVMVDRDLRVRRYTAMAERNMNLVSADIGRSLADIRTNLRIDNFEALVSEVIDTMQVREREVQDRDGRWYVLRVRPYRTLENHVDGAVLILVDVDELKRFQFALAESEERFRLLANSAPVPIWVSDLEGPRFVNRGFEEFVGATEHDIRMGDPAHYVHPDDRSEYLGAFERAFAKRQALSTRVRLRRVDGAYRWMKVVAVPSYLSNGELLGLIGCAFDITEMEEADAALREFDRGREEFLAMLAHELRNPLAGIRNASRILSLPESGPDQSAARDIIDRQTSNMTRMVDELLDVARVTHGKITLKCEPVDLAALVRRVLAGARVERGQVTTPTLPAAPIWVNADPMRLEQVLANLLDNASKFTGKGGHIWVSLEREKLASTKDAPLRDYATVRVRDDGVGIERALLPHVFELFTQAEPLPGQSRVGIGLGLALAKGIVELHGGTLEAISMGNALGSEFVMRLPETDKAQPEPRRAGIRHVAPGAARRILVVDDNADSVASMQALLRTAGHDVAVAHNGASALERIASGKPDIVLLDIGLPDMDGYEVARRLREIPGGREALVIAITGFGRTRDLQRSREAGIDEHLVKPLDTDALAQLIGRGKD